MRGKKHRPGRIVNGITSERQVTLLTVTFSAVPLQHMSCVLVASERFNFWTIRRNIGHAQRKNQSGKTWGWKRLCEARWKSA